MIEMAKDRRKKMMKLDIKERYRRFREWQETPFSYTMNEETHRCNNCEYEYTGNFCPRCGQKATMGKAGWASVRENIMEIWGVGTRSMTYSIWQLLWRPGNFVRDYISGKRQVSFPPVKMLLIVALICTVLAGLLDFETADELNPTEDTDGLQSFFDWGENNMGWSFLIIYSMFLLPTWVLFRFSPRFPAHSLPQGFFIQVFLSTLGILVSFISEIYLPLAALIPLYYFIIYYQLFGYGVWGTLWRTGCCMMVGLMSALAIITPLSNVFNELAERISDDPTHLLKAKITIAAMFFIIGAVILAIGYAISWRTWKKRTKATGATA